MESYIKIGPSVRAVETTHTHRHTHIHTQPVAFSGGWVLGCGDGGGGLGGGAYLARKVIETFFF